MTRGTAYIFYEDGFMYTTEFNGDMYPGGNGDDMYQLLSQATPETFYKLMHVFNRRHHNYNDCQIVMTEKYLEDSEKWVKKRDGKTGSIVSLDFNDYYAFWFSDYIFIKNWTTGKMTINLASDVNNTFYLPQGEVGVFNFGETDDHLVTWEDKQSKIFHARIEERVPALDLEDRQSVLSIGLFEKEITATPDRVRQVLGTPTWRDGDHDFWSLAFGGKKMIECMSRVGSDETRFDAFTTSSEDWSDEFSDYILSLELLDEMTV